MRARKPSLSLFFLCALATFAGVQQPRLCLETLSRREALIPNSTLTLLEQLITMRYIIYVCILRHLMSDVDDFDLLVVLEFGFSNLIIWFIGMFFFLIVLKGNLADPRMRAASKRRGIEITSISRPIRPSDFRDFDIILAMDKQNRGRIYHFFSRFVSTLDGRIVYVSSLKLFYHMCL